MSAAKPGRDPRSDRGPEVVCESDPRTGGPNRLHPGSRRRSRTLAAPPTRATNDRPCRLPIISKAGTQSSHQVIVPISSLQQQSPAVGTALALIELGNDWLAKNSWEQQTLCCAIV